MEKVANAHPLRPSQDYAALASGLLAPLTWGFTGVFVRLLHGIPTLIIVSGRLVVAALVLAPWAYRRRQGFPAAIRSPLAATMGAYYVFATEAFARAPVVEVTLLVGTAPVIALGLEQVRGIPPVRQQVIGAAVAVLGMLIFLRPGTRVSNAQTVGYLFALGAATVSAAYAVGMRARAQSGRPLDPLALTVLACALGAVASCLPLGTGILPSAWQAPSTAEIVYLALLGSLCTAVPTLAFGVASARLPSVLTTSLGLMTPLFAAVFAGLVLHEWPAVAAVPGALITILGVVMVLRAPAGLSRSE